MAFDAPRTEDECFPVESLQQRLYALGEPDDIGVVAPENELVAFMCDTYDIDGSDGACLRTDVVEIAYHASPCREW